LGIATNLIRKHARSEERRRRAYARAVDLDGDEGGLDGLAARADAAAQGPAIAAAVSRLAPDDRDTLLLWALTDLDYDGIATATAVPVGTVRSRRSADGESEVSLLTYEHFADRDPLARVVLERMLAGVSTRRYRRTQEPVALIHSQTIIAFCERVHTQRSWSSERR
jgi:hypothetical protein